ncbi:MAG: PIN domain-containing protein [Acidimicrobiales bacterium]
MVDTGVFGADLVPGSELSDLYGPVLRGRPAFISFQTVSELRYGARRRGWGELRMRQLEARISQAEIVYPGPELIDSHVLLRVACAQAGHALADRVHDADRWIAATAIRLAVPLVSHDGVFQNAPGLDLESRLSGS